MPAPPRPLLPRRISPDHPLRRFLDDLARRHFSRDARICDGGVSQYVSGMLVEFAHADNLYQIRNSQGRRLEEVGEMLIESNPLLGAESFIREREVRKHIGDYTLFLTGLLPEYAGSLPRRRLRLDAFLDYVEAGKESYAIVSSFDQFEYRDEAALFRRLAQNFEWCAWG